MEKPETVTAKAVIEKVLEKNPERVMVIYEKNSQITVEWADTPLPIVAFMLSIAQMAFQLQVRGQSSSL